MMEEFRYEEGVSVSFSRKDRPNNKFISRGSIAGASCTYMEFVPEKNSALSEVSTWFQNDDACHAHLPLPFVVYHFPFWTAILKSTVPELLGIWYTNSNWKTDANTVPSNTSKPAAATSDCEQQKICYCVGPEEWTMVACDNVDSSIEWFHTECPKIATVPKGKWYWPDCRKLPKFNQKGVYTSVGDWNIAGAITNIHACNEVIHIKLYTMY